MITEAHRKCVRDLRTIVNRYDADPFAAIAYETNHDMKVIRDCARLCEDLLTEIDRLTETKP